MFLTVIYVWIGLSILASVLVLAAVIRSGQVEQMARDGLYEDGTIPPKPPSATHSPEPHPSYTPGRVPTPEQEWGTPVRASRFTTDIPTDKL